MLKKCFLLFAAILMATILMGQTNPSPQTVPYSQNFSDLAHNSTAYPNGWQGWSVPGSPGSDFKTTAPGGDRTLTASSSASTTSGNVHNYDGKIGTLNNSSTDLTLALALNTTGTQNVTVVYDVMTIRNPYDGGSNTRINEITLQYRVGTTGTFNTLTGIEYQNNTVTQTTGTTPQNLQNMVISLPPDCDNQEVVQIRWITRQASGGGSRPSFAIDNIDISADPISNDPAINITQNLGQFITYVGIPSEVQTYHLSGISLASPISIATSLPFQIRLPEGEWLTVLEVASDFSGTIEVRFNPSSAGAVNLPLSHVSFDAEMNQIAEFFILSGNAVDATPTINVTSNLTAFNTIVENPSAAQSYTLSGLFFTGNISLSLTDPVNFEISTDGGSNYAPTGSVASDFNGLIYVRMTGVAVGSFSANITHSSPGAGTVNTAISGTVNNPAAPMIFFEENFDYSASSTLVSNGWTAHSGTGTNSPYVTTPNLTYPSYPLFSGLSAYLRPSGEDVHRTFTPATEGSVYASFLVSVEAASTGGDYFFHLGPDPISTTFRARVFVKTDASNNLAFGILKGSITAETAWTGFDYSLNSTYLVLVKYDIIPGDGNDTVALWINPDFSATEPAPQVTATDSNSDISVASVAVRQGNAGNLVSGLVDGIRISNNWNLHWQQTAVDGDILVSGEMEPFLAIAGAPSERQFYHVQGQDLTSNITIQAPDGFELSISNDVNDPWDGVLTVPPTFNGNVFVRMLVPEPGLYAGNIVHTSGGADPVSFSVNGEAFEPAGEIIVAADFTPFYGTTTTPSAVQSYNLSGSDLSGDIFVSVANPYQIKVSSSETWTNSLQLPSTFNGSIDVRLNSTTAGTFNATLLHESAEASNVDINLSGTVSVGVPDLATLRTMSTGTTVYTVTGEVYLTFQQAFRNQKFVQDATAGILIDDFNAVISTAFNPGDGITNLTGTISEYGGMLQFVPTRNPLAASSTGNVINPQPISLAQLESNFEAYESELVKVLNVSFTAPGSFANGSMYQITDGNITFPFRTTFYDVDYIGTVIPETAKDIVGIPNSRVSEGNNFTARSLADFSDPVAAIATKLAITSIDPASPYINTAFSVSIQSLGDDNAPVNVDEDTQITLSLATGTGTLSGTLTGTILTGSNSASLSGVLYNTAETGVSITASATSGQTLLPVTSAAFEVLTIPDNPTVTALARPAQIDLSAATSQSAVLMQLQSYPTDDVRYRLYNGGNQYNCWDGTQYVSSTSYSGGPQPLGTPSTSATWWIIFERGSNINPAASYRDRQGPAYDSNFQT
ncbi:MAG: hypothetical protein PHI68_00905, partial [Candidatus Cloacimonetes bacterium]|nr:hypothetical protein [Candidatus Cloacimonadota bacterium]